MAFCCSVGSLPEATAPMACCQRKAMAYLLFSSPSCFLWKATLSFGTSRKDYVTTLGGRTTDQPHPGLLLGLESQSSWQRSPGRVNAGKQSMVQIFFLQTGLRLQKDRGSFNNSHLLPTVTWPLCLHLSYLCAQDELEHVHAMQT